MAKLFKINDARGFIRYINPDAIIQIKENTTGGNRAEIRLQAAMVDTVLDKRSVEELGGQIIRECYNKD